MRSSELIELIKELTSAVYAVQREEEIADELAFEIAKTLELLLTKIDEAEALEKEEIKKPFEVPNDARLLWVLSGSNPEAFVKYLQTYSTNETQALLANPDLLKQTIQLLSKELPLSQRGIENGIPQADLQSSNVWGIAYEPKTAKMRVKFQGGSIYEYDGVPANIYKAFASGAAVAKTKGKNRFGSWWIGKTPSLGAAMHEYIKKSKFPFRKIS